MSKGINASVRDLSRAAPKTLQRYTSLMALGTNMHHYVKTQTGAVTANTYKQMLSLTGPGVLEFLALTSDDATVRTVTVQIILDGVVATHTVTFNGGGAGYGMVPVGWGNGQFPCMQKQNFGFQKSCVINIQSTLTETNKSTCYWAYRLC
jgi:hypothetical protein